MRREGERSQDRVKRERARALEGLLRPVPPFLGNGVALPSGKGGGVEASAAGVEQGNVEPGIGT